VPMGLMAPPGKCDPRTSLAVTPTRGIRFAYAIGEIRLRSLVDEA
jgi:hypothetical protein